MTGEGDATRELLRRLAASDERSLRDSLSPYPPPDALCAPALDRGTRALVALAALIAAGAETASLRWAVDRAGATGAGDETVVGVLVAAGVAAGAAQASASAVRLALALDLDVEAERAA